MSKKLIDKIVFDDRLSSCYLYMSTLRKAGVEVDGLSLTNAFLDDMKRLQEIAMEAKK